MSTSLEDLIEPNQNSTPEKLLHLAIQRGADMAVVEYLIKSVPHQLSECDNNGRIPLHYACSVRSPFLSLPMVRVLVEAAPHTVLIRLEEHCEDGMLPSVLAHNHGASATIVKYLLCEQIRAQQGLVLTHLDLAHLLWNQAIFMEYLSEAVRECRAAVKKFCLFECIILHESWSLLQSAIDSVAAGTLGTLRIIHLHVWHSHADDDKRQSLLFYDVELWQQIIDKHHNSLRILEVPQFYALAPETVYRLSDYLVSQPHLLNLQNLDITSKESHNRPVAVDKISEALAMPDCKLKKLSIGNVREESLLQLFAHLQRNRSLQCLSFGNIADWRADWEKLRQTVVNSLDYNTTLEYLLGPRPIVQCSEVQFYLQLNRYYRRKDIGRWSPTLVAYVLGKHAKEGEGSTDSGENDNGAHANRCIKRNQEDIIARSAIFYILQSRPDIIVPDL